MIPEEIEEEVERLKAKKLEFMAKSNLTNDFNQREEYELEIKKIQDQIATLEKLRRKP